MSIYKNPTIAIIDSGIGGVSILRQIIRKFQYGNFIYFADNLYMPYGNKSSKWLKNRLSYIINTLKDTYSVDYVIIACNTASACINSDIKDIVTMQFKENYTYLATSLTKQKLHNINVIPDKTLATQIESNINNQKKLNLIIKKHVKQHKLNELNEFVLGCTHYELVKPIFEKLCPNTRIINNSIFMINSISFYSPLEEISIKILLSKQSRALEETINRLIKEEAD